MHLSKSEDTGAAHLPKIKTRPDWLKPLPKEETPETPEPDWVIPLNNLPETKNNWVDALAKTYKDPKENKLLQKTGDMASFIQWFCKQIGKKKLVKAEFEGQAYKIVKPFHKNNISLQFQMEECYLLLTDQIDLTNTEDLEYLVSGNKERRHALSISKLKAAYYPHFELEELVPSLWTESESDYDISLAYVRSHMKILSVVSLKTYSRYGYTFLKEIVLRRADYKEYKISEADFKNLHPNDFEDMYLLNLQGKLNHLSGADKVHLSTTLNLYTRNIVIKQRVKDLQLDIESY
ncbi:hypothetical protein Tco_0862761 [Tanacetum coccineum]